MFGDVSAWSVSKPSHGDDEILEASVNSKGSNEWQSMSAGTSDNSPSMEPERMRGNELYLQMSAKGGLKKVTVSFKRFTHKVQRRRLSHLRNVKNARGRQERMLMAFRYDGMKIYEEEGASLRQEVIRREVVVRKTMREGEK